MKWKCCGLTSPAIAAAALVFSLYAPGSRAEGIKIAVVDLYRVVGETEDGKNAMQELESYFGKKQKSLDKKSESLKLKMEDLKKKQKIMNAQDYQEEVDELQAEIVELQNTYMKYQKLVARKEMDLTEPIMKKLEKVLEKIGKDNGYTLILRKEAVAWIPEAKDITEEVIKIYNKEPLVEFKKQMEEKDKGKGKGKEKGEE